MKAKLAALITSIMLCITTVLYHTMGLSMKGNLWMFLEKLYAFIMRLLS